MTFLSYKPWMALLLATVLLSAACGDRETPAQSGSDQGPARLSGLLGSNDGARRASSDSQEPLCEPSAVIRHTEPVPFRLVIIGLDISSSPPPGMWTEGWETAAQYVQQLPAVGGGARVLVVLIGRDSYSLESLLPPIVITAVIPPRYPADLPEEPNPVDARDRQRYRREMAQWCNQAEEQNRKMDEALDVAREKAAEGANLIRSVDREPEDGTDFAGFFARLAQQTATVSPQSIKEAFIVSDMDPWPPEQLNEPLPSLSGGRVTVSDWGTDRVRGQELRQAWMGRFDMAGAGLVDWLPPRQAWGN